MSEAFDLIRGIWARFEETGHLDDLVGGTVAILAEDVEVRDHDVPDAPLHRGRDGYFQWLRNWDDAWEKWTIEPREYLDAGDRVIVVFKITATGRGSGLEIDREDAIVHELRDGKLAKVDYFNNRRDALVLAGLGG